MKLFRRIIAVMLGVLGLFAMTFALMLEYTLWSWDKMGAHSRFGGAEPVAQFKLALADFFQPLSFGSPAVQFASGAVTVVVALLIGSCGCSVKR